jgi:hypothetical protein
MNIIERYMISKFGDTARCEDAIVVNNDFACVIDGASSKSGKIWEGKPSGLMAAHILSQHVHRLPKDVRCLEAIDMLTNSIAEYYRRNNLYEDMKNVPAERFTATIALYSRFQHELWIVGDIQCLVDHQLHTSRMLIDDVVVNARALYLACELMRGKDQEGLAEADPGRTFVQPLIGMQAVFQNADTDSPYAFGVIDGFQVPERLIKQVKLPAHSRQLVLMSDGYPDPRPTLQEAEARLQAILQNDPLCIQLYKAVKGLGQGRISYDDRAYLRIAL